MLSIAVKHLARAGFSNEDIIYAVEMMEEAETSESRLGVFVEIVRAHDLPGAIAGPALLEMATAAVAAPSRYSVARRDDFSTYRDSNRARRGMANRDWRELRQQILERDGHRCQYCFRPGGDLTCDHIVPLIRGGTNDPANLTTACRSCNSSKGDKLLAEWSPL